MRIIKKTHLHWSEPDFLGKDFRKKVSLRQRLRNNFSQLARVFAVVAVILVIMSLFSSHPPQPSGQFLVEVGNLFFLSLIVSLIICSEGWLNQYLPSFISFQNDGIRRIIGQQTQFISYKEIKHCAIKNLTVEANEVKVLEIIVSDGRNGYIEIPSTISTKKIVDVLSQAGLKVDHKEFET